MINNDRVVINGKSQKVVEEKPLHPTYGKTVDIPVLLIVEDKEDEKQTD